jgi:transcriptional regulator with XRE-family HTH domain
LETSNNWKMSNGPGAKKPHRNRTAAVLPDLTTRSMVGGRLRALRVHRGIPLAEVADATGLSRTFVGLVEKGKSEIAVSRLLRLADYYGVTLEDLVGTSDPAVEVVRLQVARNVPTGVEGAELYLLATNSSRINQPFMVELEPGALLDGLAHTGEEFLTCTDGSVIVQVAEAIHQLFTGDTIFFPGRLTHGYRNPASEPARIVGSVVRMGA